MISVVARRRDWRVASLIISTNSGLSAMTGSLRKVYLRKKPVCARLLNEAFPNYFDLDASRELSAISLLSAGTVHVRLGLWAVRVVTAEFALMHGARLLLARFASDNDAGQAARIWSRNVLTSARSFSD
jgi:hypothetical protein